MKIAHVVAPIAIRRRVVDALIRHGGRPLTAKSLERIRDFASYSLGAGAASLPLAQSGECKLLKHLAKEWAERKSITVVDVGAHKGDYATAVRACFGARARIHSFEPNPSSFDALAGRFDSDPRVQCHRLALGAAPGTARLFSKDPGSPMASLHSESFGGAAIAAMHSEDVDVETLDRLAGPLELSYVDLLKVDVEGHELAVLEGAKNLLGGGGVGVVQFEFGERNLASRTYLRDFISLLGPGFQLFRLGPRGLTRLDYRHGSEVFLLEANYVAMRDSSPAGR